MDPVSQARSLLLACDDRLMQRLEGRISTEYSRISLPLPRESALLEALAPGSVLVWIGSGETLPKDLWIGVFHPLRDALRVTEAEGSPLDFDGIPFRQTKAASAFLQPPEELPMHNVDEEPRAEFLPLLEARDRFGQTVGYPGVLMSHFAPSFVRRRFGGCDLFFFLFDDPVQALDVNDWAQMLERIARRWRSGLQMRRVETGYASYRPGERVRARAVVANLRRRLAAAEIRFLAQRPGENAFHPILTLRRLPDGGGESEAVCEFIPQGAPGLWRLRAEVWQDPEHAEEPSVPGAPVLIDRREIGFVVQEHPVRTPALVSLQGASIRLAGCDGFHVGTHYYPSSSWWEWAWRDFRPLKAETDFRAMRRAGYRLVRIWVDQAPDETVLRAIDAAIYLAAQNGIALIICLFTQWHPRLGFERESGEHVSFEVRGPRDFNIFGISFRSLSLQKEYAALLAKRWRRAGNILYNLANETYLRDPDPEQMDAEAAAWEETRQPRGERRDTLLFRRWVREISQAIRAAGGRQPIIPGYLFSTMGGGNSYLGNRDGEIASWHSYLPPEMTGLTLRRFDPACSGRPLLLEEMGTSGWNSAAHYEADACYALAAGAAGAISYEWGVSWLMREMCYTPAPFRDALADDPDPRWFSPVLEIARLWQPTGVGTFPAPSGFAYGSIYHGTPFPAEAAAALGRMGKMGGELGRALRSETLYVAIPDTLPDREADAERIYRLFRTLWAEKAIFGVIQEECLDRLPASARILLCPMPLSPESVRLLERIRQNGTRVWTEKDDPEGWRRLPNLPRVSVTPGDGISLLTRRTRSGTLFTLLGGEETRSVTLRAKGMRETVSFGLQQYGFAHFRRGRLSLAEAAGSVEIDGCRLCEIETGRVALMAEDGAGLSENRALRLLAKEPTRVLFAREIRLLAALEEGGAEPLAVWEPESPDRRTLTIDETLTRYLLRVEFSGAPCRADMEAA